jgi:NAD+ synthase
MDYGSVTKRIISFMRTELARSGKKGFVVGLSGGLDSSVVTALASKAVGSKVRALILPSGRITPGQDIEDAVDLCKKLKVSYEIIDVEDIYSSLVTVANPGKVGAGNILARLRMCLLYAYANANDLLVLGTSDRSEFLIGYFTKYGDGAADLLPIASLYKLQVRALAKYLKLPESIVTKRSSPRLWEGQTAEDEIGLTYEEIDSILYCLVDLKRTPTRTAKELRILLKKVMTIRFMHERTDHKRSMPKICKI